MSADAPAGAVHNTTALAACVAFPWLWHLPSGPTATALPWLVSASSAIVTMVLVALMRSNFPQATAWGLMLAALFSILWFCAFLLLSVIVRDYIRVEASYQTLRFEWARIKTPPAQIPDVLILNQWPDFFRFVKLHPVAGMGDAQLAAIRNTAALNPGAGSLQTLAIALARNGRPDEAALWLRRMCKTATVSQCELVKKAWLLDAQSSPEIAAVPWPS
jgi:hypothetical protein